MDMRRVFEAVGALPRRAGSAPMIKPGVLLAGIGLAIGGWLGYNLAYVPQQKQARMILAQVAEELAAQRTQADAAAVLEQVERYRARLPEEPDPSWLVHYVVELAQQSGVQVTTVAQQPPKELAQVTRLAVSLHGAASYHQLGAFLDALEGARRFMRVEQVQVSRGQEAEQEPTSIQVTVSTLYMPPAAIRPAGTPTQGPG